MDLRILRPIRMIFLILACLMNTRAVENRSGPDPVPILTSLGVTREDGAPVGVIGGSEQFRLQAPSGKTFREVAWRISGTIGKSEVRFNQNPLITPLPNPMVILTPEDTTEVIIEFYWDGSAGPRSIDVSAIYSDGTGGIPDGFRPPIKD